MKAAIDLLMKGNPRQKESVNKAVEEGFYGNVRRVIPESVANRSSAKPTPP